MTEWKIERQAYRIVCIYHIPCDRIAINLHNQWICAQCDKPPPEDMVETVIALRNAMVKFKL